MKLLKKLLSNLLLGALFVCFIIAFVVFKNWDAREQNFTSPQIELMNQIKTYDSMNEILQIEVLNGCGDKGVADLYANFLRNNSYDVIDYKNADNFDYNASKLIVHSNNLLVEDVADLFANIEPVMEIIEFMGAESSRAICQPLLKDAA